MKKIVIGLFILSSVLFSTIKGSLWYFTQKFVDAQIYNAKPLVEITYKKITTSFPGTATISGISLYIPLMEESIHIKSVQLIATDLKSLLRLDSQLQNNELPKSLGVILSGIKLDLNSPFMKSLDDPKTTPSHLENFSTLACGNTRRIGSKELIKMGYDTIINDMVISYQFDARKKALHYNIQNNFQAFALVNLTGSINAITDLNSLFTAKLGNIELEITDDTYLGRKNRFCAKQGNRSVADYIKAHTLQVEEYLLSYGIAPEDGLLKAYQQSIEEPGSIRFEADLSNLTGMSEINTFTPNDLIQFTHLKLYLNDQKLNEISINIDKGKLIDSAGSESIATPEQVKKKYNRVIKKYRPVTIHKLSQYAGYRVKIKTKNGKQFKGILKLNPHGVFEVFARLRAGNISYHIESTNIKKAEIFN